MIAWLALVLGLLNLAVWALVGLAGRKLYLQAKPMLQMMGLGAAIEAPPGLSGDPLAPLCQESEECQAPGHTWRCPRNPAHAEYYG